jgi:hypothetical protein
LLGKPENAFSGTRRMTGEAEARPRSRVRALGQGERRPERFGLPAVDAEKSRIPSAPRERQALGCRR